MNIYIDLPLEDYYHAREGEPFKASGKIAVEYPKLNVEVAFPAKLVVNWIGAFEEEIPYLDLPGLGTLYQPGARRYLALTDKDYLPSKEDYKRALYVFDLYAYIHGGIALSVELPFGDPWDSGKIGEILISRKDLIEWFGAKALRKWDEIERRNMALVTCRRLFADINDIINGQVYEMSIFINDIEAVNMRFYDNQFRPERKPSLTLPADYQPYPGLESLIIEELKLYFQ